MSTALIDDCLQHFFTFSEEMRGFINATIGRLFLTIFKIVSAANLTIQRSPKARFSRRNRVQ